MVSGGDVVLVLGMVMLYNSADVMPTSFRLGRSAPGTTSGWTIVIAKAWLRVTAKRNII